MGVRRQLSDWLLGMRDWPAPATSSGSTALLVLSPHLLRLCPGNGWAQLGTQQDPPGPVWCSSAGDSSSRTYHWTRWNITRTALQSKTSAPSFPLRLRGQTGISIWRLSQMEEPPCLAASAFSLTGISPSTSHTSVPTLASTSHRTQTNKMYNSKYLDQCKWVTIIPYESCTFRSM